MFFCFVYILLFKVFSVQSVYADCLKFQSYIKYKLNATNSWMWYKFFQMYTLGLSKNEEATLSFTRGLAWDEIEMHIIFIHIPVHFLLPCADTRRPKCIFLSISVSTSTIFQPVWAIGRHLFLKSALISSVLQIWLRNNYSRRSQGSKESVEQDNRNPSYTPS